MKRYESFGQCLKQCLDEYGISASEAARLVGFRSRNSIFRILSDDASGEIKLRFLSSLRDAIGEDWSEACWNKLQEALIVERLGTARYHENKAFHRLLHEKEPETHPYKASMGDGFGEVPLAQVFAEATRSERAEIIVTGCCDAGIAMLLADQCGEAGSKGRLTVRHYIDTGTESVCRNILGVLPLISKPWYNARLVDENACPPEMMAIYRLNCIHFQCWDESGKPYWNICVRYDQEHFTVQEWRDGLCPAVAVVDKWRFQLELLKPLDSGNDGAELFVDYTKHYADLENNCTILSIKPDAHFNCIPSSMLEQAVLEGLEQSGIAAGPELVEVMKVLKAVHDTRFENMLLKRKPTHLIYSLPAMERFMHTGVLSDHFFVQRAYTVEERRRIIQVLLDAMRKQPYFHVHFLKEGGPPLRYELSFFDGKGVLLMDAYTGYELAADHSEALITLPAFMEGFRQFYVEELLTHHVMTRTETLRTLERLIKMNVSE